jgi:hypothetical protein
VIGKTIGRAASARADKMAAERAGKIEEAGKKYKDDSREAKVDQLRRFAESPGKSVGAKKEAQALLLDAMGDEKSMKELRASGDLEKLWKQHGGSLTSDAKGNKDFQSRLSAFKKQNADITGATGDIKDLKDVTGLNSFALTDDKVKTRMAEIETTIKKDSKDGGGFYNAREAMEKGLIGNREQRDAMTRGVGAIYEGMNETELSRVPMASLAVNATPELLNNKDHGEKVAQQLLTSQNVEVRNQLQTRVAADPKMRGALLHKSSGLGLNDDGTLNGKIEDNKKFSLSLASNPAMMSLMDDQTFANVTGDNEQMMVMGEILSKAQSFKSAVKSIKADPKSEASKQLRTRMEAILGSADENTSLEVQQAEQEFVAHMKVVDEGTRVQKITASVKAVPGKIRTSVNTQIDASSVSSAVDDLAKEAELSAQVDKTPAEDLSKGTLQELGGVQTSLEGKIQNIASSDVLTKQLDEELDHQVQALVEKEAQIAQQTSKNTTVYQTRTERANIEARIKQTQELKTRVEIAKEELEEAKKNQGVEQA